MAMAGLTPRQIDALQGLANGMTYGEIAAKYGMATSTVRTHLHNVYKKLGVIDRAQAVLVGYEQGLLKMDDRVIDAPDDSVTAWALRNEKTRLDRELTQMRQELDETRQELEETQELVNNKITATQRVYLWAFERYLRCWAACDAVAERRSRQAMRLAAGGILSPELLQLSQDRDSENPLDRVAKTLLAFEEATSAAAA